MASRVAIIVRTKDRPYFLERALDDIAAQTFGDVEVAVVNDGGDPSRVREVVAASAIPDRVTVLETGARTGRCAAANAGIRATSAPYVVLHDDDDRWHPEFLERTVAALDASDDSAGVMVRTDIVLEERRGNGWAEVGRVPFWEGMTAVTFTSLLEVNRAVPISFLYRRALHDEVGYYDEGLETVEDWDFYLRVAARHPFVFLAGTALAFWTQRPESAGADANSMFELAGQHDLDDLRVRDSALRAWVADNGPGLPLYLALIERRLRQDFERTLDAKLHEQRERIVSDFYASHPIWRRLRRVRSLLRRG